jgi:hypothetical protein
MTARQSFRAWLKSLDGSYRRKQREWECAQAAEWYIEVAAVATIAEGIDKLQVMLIVEQFIYEMQHDAAFKDAGQRRDN